MNSQPFFQYRTRYLQKHCGRRGDPEVCMFADLIIGRDTSPETFADVCRWHGKFPQQGQALLRQLNLRPRKFRVRVELEISKRIIPAPTNPMPKERFNDYGRVLPTKEAASGHPETDAQEKRAEREADIAPRFHAA